MDLGRPDPLAIDLLARLRSHGLTLGTAESLTGGLLGATLTSVPGSSAVYVGGLVTYATGLKVSLLGVPQSVVDGPGVVSAECVEAMAGGVRRVTGADVGLATTGVAGPGPQDGLPAGTVWVAAALPGRTVTRRLDTDGDRWAVRVAACVGVLELLDAEIPPSA